MGTHPPTNWNLTPVKPGDSAVLEGFFDELGNVRAAVHSPPLPEPFKVLGRVAANPGIRYIAEGVWTPDGLRAASIYQAPSQDLFAIPSLRPPATPATPVAHPLNTDNRHGGNALLGGGARLPHTEGSTHSEWTLVDRVHLSVAVAEGTGFSALLRHPDEPGLENFPIEFFSRTDTPVPHTLLHIGDKVEAHGYLLTQHGISFIGPRWDSSTETSVQLTTSPTWGPIDLEKFPFHAVVVTGTWTGTAVAPDGGRLAHSQDWTRAQRFTLTPTYRSYISSDDMARISSELAVIAGHPGEQFAF